MRIKQRLIISAIIVLMVATSCASISSPLDSVPDTQAGGVISTSVPIDTQSTSTEDFTEPINDINDVKFPGDIVGTSIPLIKEEYQYPAASFDESEWNLKSDEVLGNTLDTVIQVRYYEKNISVEENWCAAVIDTKTDELLMLLYSDAYILSAFDYQDLDGDGTRELLYKPKRNKITRYIYHMQDGILYQIDFEKSVTAYMAQFSITPDCRASFRRLPDNLCILDVLKYEDDGICYQNTRLYCYFFYDEILISDEKTRLYNRYQPFISNDPLYSTEFIYEPDEALIVHAGDISYTYDVGELQYGYTKDISLPRELIVHPTLPYFALVYPVQTQTSSDARQLALSIMSTETGERLETIPMENVTSNYTEEVRSAIYETDIGDFTINNTICELTPTDTGFHYTESVIEDDGNVLFDCFYEADLILN